jgi:hypothetical protein
MLSTGKVLTGKVEAAIPTEAEVSATAVYYWHPFIFVTNLLTTVIAM